jgi:hypothetical protein
MNSAHIPTLQEFIAYSRGFGFSRSDRFVANFQLPIGLQNEDARVLNLLCEEAAFPGAAIQSRQLRINGLTEYRPSSIEYGNEGISLQFLIDSKWSVRYVMERWMDLCSDMMTRTGRTTSVGRDQNTNAKAREVGWYNEYATTVNLFALVPGLLVGPFEGPKGEENSSIKDRALGKLKQLASGQLDRVKTEVKSRIDPRAVSILRDAERILGTYSGDQNSFDSAPPEVAVFNVTLHEAWPREIFVQPTSSYNPGFHRLNVVFTYKYWTTEYFSPEVSAKSAINTPETFKDFVKDKAIPAAASVIANRAGILRARNIPLPPFPR